jgi:hypothetical protein
LRAERPTSLRVRSSDAGATWLLQLESDGVTSTREDEAASPAVAAACTVSGTAADLYLALWNRGRREELTVDGDGAVLAHFLCSVQVR